MTNKIARQSLRHLRRILRDLSSSKPAKLTKPRAVKRGASRRKVTPL